MDRVYRQGGKINTDDFLRNRTIEIVKDPNKTKIMLDSLLNEEISNSRILCLSRTRSNNIMWSHYSDKHTGVCIKIDTHKDFPFFTFPLKVEYKSKYPTENYIQARKKQSTIKTILGTKSIHWKYEKEIRIVKDKRVTTFKNEGLLEYNKDVLVEINFGLKSSIEDIMLTREIISKFYNSKVKINKAKKMDLSFNLAFEGVK